MPYEPIDLARLQVTSLEARPSKVSADDRGRTVAAEASFRTWFDALPNILAGAALRELVARTARAIERGRPVLVGLGGHVIKVGLGGMVCDLLRDGYATAVACNGAVIVHDAELALIGKTSEDVDMALQDGTFGMSAQTASFVLGAIAREPGQGLGRAVGDALLAANPPGERDSVLATCARHELAACVTVAIGTDIVHAHPQADGAALGRGALVDFRLLCSVVSDLLDGGVYLNFGSAVLLPEAFLKAVSVARNLGARGDFTTADFDFVRQYRPQTNVVRRPHLGTGGKGFAFTGHHELLFPLFWQAVRTEVAA
ncbi:MAG: hypothetical protein GIX03_05140 [Candidatus Eremiobacteraeota bacterium]|nr:hypothetical protein [Candidatus Eremiobacteraeota bacterium]MBC5802382.1 hypothetical protein [Candidatus Eremiobacteraeota bacterium]MBC5820600.1 hypothetical protein [Candidatus Eremiobacteraeota bacterium]